MASPAPATAEEPAPACLRDAPPRDAPVALLVGGEGACPPAFAICMLPGPTGTLLNQRAALRRWSDEAWIRCGPGPAMPPPAAPPAPPAAP